MLTKEPNVITELGLNKLNYSVKEIDGIFNTCNTQLSSIINNNSCLVVIGENVYHIYGSLIYNYFETYLKDKYKIITITDLENNKNMSTITYILDEAQKMGLDRKGIMIGIGGGITMDMVGFASSMYRRKIEYIRIPTTLIGFVDAGIGIKTGINYHSSKNFIGAFYPPKICLNDYSFLNTLSVIEIRNGISEMLKMGIIIDAKLFARIEGNIDDIIVSKCTCKEGRIAIYEAIYDMLRELDKNFYEECLERLVDFGHTFSPFIEVSSNYKIPHGHAVTLDMAISCDASYKLGFLSLADRNKILNVLLKAGLKVYDDETFKSTEMANSLKNIILHRGGNLNLVLPSKIGKAFFYKEDITSEFLNLIFDTLKNYQLNFKYDESKYCF